MGKTPRKTEAPKKIEPPAPIEEYDFTFEPEVPDALLTAEQLLAKHGPPTGL